MMPCRSRSESAWLCPVSPAPRHLQTVLPAEVPSPRVLHMSTHKAHGKTECEVLFRLSQFICSGSALILNEPVQLKSSLNLAQVQRFFSFTHFQ